jgi:hypothetical protein
MQDFKSFDELWETCEAHHAKYDNRYPIRELSFLIKDLEDVLSKPAATQKAFMEMYVGKMLWILTSLSQKEDINVFAVLLKQLEMAPQLK